MRDFSRKTLEQLVKDVKCLKCQISQIETGDIYVNAATFNPATGILTLVDNSADTPDVTVDISSLGASANWANTNLALTGNRTHDFASNSITENNVGAYTTNLQAAANRKITWDSGAGVTITSGVGPNPAGFTGGGADTTYMVTPGTRVWGGIYQTGGNGFAQFSAYDNTFSTDESGLVVGPLATGGNSTYAQIYHNNYSGGSSGLVANVLGERILSESTGLNRLSALGAANGIVILSGAGATGYVATIDQDGLTDWMDNFFVNGWGGIYTGSGSTQAGVTTVTIPTGSSILFDGDFAGTLFEIDGDTGKITIDGLLDPSGLQLAPQGTNPGDAQTLWSNSGDLNNPYWGVNPLAFSGDNIYGVDGTLTTNRTLDGDDLILTFTNTDWFKVESNGKVTIDVGDPVTFTGRIAILEAPFSALNITGNNTTSGQGGSFIIREQAGTMLTSIGLTDGAEQQALIMHNVNGTSYTNTKNGFSQPYTFSYQPSTLGTQFRSYMAHYTDISTSGTGNDVMGMSYLNTIGAGADFREFHMYLDPTAEQLELIAWDNPNSHEGAVRIGYQSIVASATDIGSITLDSNGLILSLDSTLGFGLPTNADPDTNISVPANGMLSYDSTDHDVRAYVNGAWTSLLGDFQTGEVWTPSNVTTLRTFDADTPPTNAELADIIGTIIADLQSVNIFS